MRNKYLLLGAASALMLAACSEDINNGPEMTKPVENALNLTSLSPASQAGRVSLPGQTRGEKSSRLELVAKIAPVVDGSGINKDWSATGIAIHGGNAYVSWHSNHQAKVPAQNWGGAIDVIDITALAGLAGEQNANLFDATLVSQAVKFNNIVSADNGTFYVPLTSYSNGATVGRWNRGSLAMDTIALPGSSANYVKVDGNDIYAITGYNGGLFKVNADFNADGVENNIQTIVEPKADFGGKFIAGDYFLRTDDKNCQIVSLDGTTVRNEGAPLLSAPKYAERYDGETGEWIEVTDAATARHYGKHTMAVDGDFVYVGGGQGEGNNLDSPVNGLRVYAAGNNTPVWENGTNTTAVTVATVNGKKLVFAATGTGLRVYEPSATGELTLYAFEVLNYNGKGEATGEVDADGNVGSPVAGTTGHSSNFVAVGGGYIFVATGQTGVYVFRLVDKNETGFRTTTGVDETKDVKEGETLDATVPAAPEAPAGKRFVEWKDTESDDTYQPDELKEKIPSGKVIVLEPVYEDIIYTVTFDLNGGEGTALAQNLKYEESPVAPADPTKENYTFGGWSLDGTTPVDLPSYKVTEDVTFIAIWNENQKYSYTVSFNLETANGTVPASKTVEGYTPELTFSDFPPQGDITKEGYDFLGWADVPVSGQEKTTKGYKSGDAYTVTQDKTFYPLWGLKASTGGTTDAEGDEL